MNPVLKKRESHIKCLESDLKDLEAREKIVKRCGFEHRVPYEFFSLSQE
jgi:hypothetical protein